MSFKVNHYKKFVSACLIATMFSSSAFAIENPPQEGQTWNLNLRDADLYEVVQQVSKITGKQYIISQNVKRKISFSSPKPLPKEEIENLFQLTLEAQGLSVKQDGKVIRIEEPVASAPVNNVAGEYAILPLKSSKVDNIIPLLDKLLPAEGQGVYAVADRTSNAVIIYGNIESRKRIKALVESLDKKQASLVDADLFYLKYADAAKIAPVLADLLKNETDPTRPAPVIKADPSLNAIVVQGSPQLIQQVSRLITKIDIERSQVLIEAIIVEVSGELAKEIGVQIAAGDASTSQKQGTVAYDTPSGSNMLNLTSVLNALTPGIAGTIGGGLNILVGDKDTLTVLLQALSSSQYANLLSTPSIMTMDNEQARIVVGQNVPFKTGTFTNDSGSTNPFTTINREDVGITLSVLPRILNDGKVRLQVKQEVSAVVEKNLSGAADLITNKRTIDTTVLASDGEVIVLGGLMQDDSAEAKSKVPLLGDIPLVGRIFSGTNGNYTKRNLLVFLRPKVVKTPLSATEIAKTRYEKIKNMDNELFAEHEKGELEKPEKILPPAHKKPIPEVNNMPFPWMVE